MWLLDIDAQLQFYFVSSCIYLVLNVLYARQLQADKRLPGDG